MGIMRLMSTLLKHPATKNAMFEDIPDIECLMIDFNANIHYILQQTIADLNEILYYTYYIQYQPSQSVYYINSDIDISDHLNSLEFEPEYIENKIKKYNKEYNIGTTYNEIKESLIEKKVFEILYIELIYYTTDLISSLNKGNIKKIFISLDGIPSMAKMKEQRNRRFIGAHVNNISNDVAKKYKTKNSLIHRLDIFYYRSNICTGTQFMNDIQQALFHLDLGSNIDIEVSTTYIKGEGEKKIIHAMNNYDSYNSFCIMSPDSDMLILVGLTSLNSKFCNKSIYNFKIDYQKNNKYQFFDLNMLVNNYRDYYGKIVHKEITNDNMINIFFMLFVFGNDFLPRLEPLDITKHFDIICKICIDLSTSGLKLNLIINNELNYDFILAFFEELNKHTLNFAIDNYLCSQYNNYHKICQNISLTTQDLEISYHHPELMPITISYLNFKESVDILFNSYKKLYNYLKSTIVSESNIHTLYGEIHQNLNDSYLLLVLPKILNFPITELGSELGSISSNILSPHIFFSLFVKYMNGTPDYSKVKFKIKLMTNDHTYLPPQILKFNPYLVEIHKMKYSLEPYRSIFRIDNINLASINLQTSEITDLRDRYYDTYNKNNTSKRDIYSIVLNYLSGIEWLYKYYIIGESQSGWVYNYTQPPLIDDIVEYLKTKSNCEALICENLLLYGENNMSPLDHYFYVTPNEYTNANVAPNLSDVIHLIDGYGAHWLNKCQIKWNEYIPKS